MCQGSSHVSGFLHHFVFAKLATISIRVKTTLLITNSMSYSETVEHLGNFSFSALNANLGSMWLIMKCGMEGG